MLQNNGAFVSDTGHGRVFGDNLTDARAEISGVFGNDRERIITNRPLTVGMRVSFDY